MTRTTVYQGQPWEDNNEVLTDLFHDHSDGSNNRAVTLETTGGQEIHISEDEAVDIYINGTPVDDE